MRQIELFTPNLEPNYQYENLSPGDRIYNLNNCQLGNITQVNPSEIRVFWDNGDNKAVNYQDIALVRFSGFGFKSGDLVRLKPDEFTESFPLPQGAKGTIKEFFGNSISVNWDDHNDEIVSTTFPDWIEKVG